jgi:hypothetical protein
MKRSNDGQGSRTRSSRARHALGVQGSRGDQICAAGPADKFYRVIIGEMNQGPVTLPADAAILYSNRSFAKFLKTPIEAITGLRLDSLVESSERVAFAGLLETSRKRGTDGKITLHASDASPGPLRLLGPINEVLAESLTEVAQP